MQYYEATMLRALTCCMPNHSNNVYIAIATPILYHYDRENSTLITSDFQSAIDLKSYLTKHATAVTHQQACRLGVALGQWVYRFHLFGKEPHQRALIGTILENKNMADFKCSINYGRLVDTIASFPGVLSESRQLFQDIFARRFEEKVNGVQALIHGDLWSGKYVLSGAILTILFASEQELTIRSILIHDKPISSPTDIVDLMIIDWEMAHLSDYSYDIGQLLAELFLLKHFRKIAASQSLMASFMEGYGPLDIALAFRVATLFGTHLIVWGSRVPGWGDTTAVEECVRIGNAIVRAGFEEDKEWFRNGVLHHVFFTS